jgi:hypothetical protein
VYGHLVFDRETPLESAGDGHRNRVQRVSLPREIFSQRITRHQGDKHDSQVTRGAKPCGSPVQRGKAIKPRG